jgi:heparosan-N-sulfate-glucuronate 5-epimerase
VIGIRRPQELASFVPGDPDAGYYNDLRVVAEAYGTADETRAGLRGLVRVRRTANPVSIAQLGLGAWQRWRSSTAEPAWLSVVEDAADWIAANLETTGGLPYLFDMSHTYPLSAPWYSAMAQGEAVSLLVRSATSLRRPDYLDAAVSAARPLLDPGSGLVIETPEGPVLQEYPTQPPSHVLNGWIFALWGLYDIASAPRTAGEAIEAAEAAAREFDRGTRTLTARLPLYETTFGWSRYDLYPHRFANVASPFYHRLHVAQLRATAMLRPDLAELSSSADRWQAALHSLPGTVVALSRKAAFRLLKPRTTLSSA